MNVVCALCYVTISVIAAGCAAVAIYNAVLVWSDIMRKAGK